MPTPTIPNGEEHFFPIIYEGNGAGRRVGRFVPFDDSSGGTIANSLIFNNADTARMNVDFTFSGTNTQKCTISLWFKLGKSTTASGNIISAYGGSGYLFQMFKYADNHGTYPSSIMFQHYYGGSYNSQIRLNRTFEDRSKWYHLMYVWDSTESTSSDRIKIYIDGDQMTSFSTSSYPNSNDDFLLTEKQSSASTTVALGTNASQIGSTENQLYDGYLAEVNVVDGQALTPASFGLTDTSTGRWIPAQVKPHPTTTTTYTVTVVGGNPSNHPYYNVGSTNKFAINGSTATADVDLTLYEGATYRFDQSDSSNSGHPLRFSTVAHGTHASGGTEYTTNVTTVGTPGTSGSYTEITVASSAPDLHYYCSSHNGMGYQASTPNGYGTNGFRLTFSDSSSLGADTSGNSNTFTATNLVSTDQTTDSPTQNFMTFFLEDSSAGTLSEGNLLLDPHTSSGYRTRGTPKTIPQSGKWYMEVKLNVSSGTNYRNHSYGVLDLNQKQIQGLGTSTQFDLQVGGMGMGFNGDRIGWTSLFDSSTFSWRLSASSPHSMVNADLVLMAFDMDNGKAWWGTRDTSASTTYWYNSSGGTDGDPSSGANPTFTFIPTDHNFIVCQGFYPDSGSTLQWYFGSQGFNLTAPTGYEKLSQQNFPETSKGITGMSWTKDRDSGSYNHELYDSSRGAFQEIRPNATTAENTRPQALSKFLKGGFAVGDRTGMNSAGNSYVSWNWTANSGSTSSNSNGSITTTTQVNSDAGFSIIEYTGNATAGATVGHGLSSAPEWFMIKSLSLATNWYVYHKSLGATSGLYLNTTAAAGSGSANAWNQTAPTSSVITLNGSGYGSNNASATYLIYAWHEVDGFSKFGSYEGNSSSDNAFVYLGFKPAVVIFKNIDAGGTNWTIVDNKRDKFNPAGRLLIPNGTDTEYDYTSSYPLDFLSNGFKIRANTTIMGQNTIIYMAFAEHPFVGDGTSPVTAR